MLRLPLELLRQAARNRPAGYLQEVLSIGTEEGSDLLLTEDAYAALHAKYNPDSSPSVPSVSLVFPAPTLPEMAANFVGATARWLAAGLPIVERSEFTRRLTICRGAEAAPEAPAVALAATPVAPCPEWLGDAMIPRCRKCGCTALKPWLATEKCPLQKW